MSMKRLPILLSLIALVVLSASVAYWVLQLVQPAQRPLAATDVAAIPDPPIDAAATLFGGQLSAAAASNYQLTGVVAAGRESVAIIVTDGTPKALKVGKEISSGVKVQEVHPRYVMLSEGGALTRIELATDTRAGAAAQPQQPQPQPPSVQFQQPVQPQPLPQPPPQQIQPQPQPQPPPPQIQQVQPQPSGPQMQGGSSMQGQPPPPPAPTYLPPPTRNPNTHGSMPQVQ
jgi:general secretion pathway protein C